MTFGPLTSLKAGAAALALLAAPLAAPLWAQSGEAAAPAAVEIVEMFQGDADAPVTVIEYASFTCPHCATFHDSVFDELKANYIDTGKVRFVHREVYFDRFGLWAGMVARCGGPERYFGITEMVYDTQQEWTAGGDPATVIGNLRRIGKSAGLTDADLDACLSDGAKAQALVEWYQENAQADGIEGTPSFVIDGELHSNMGYDAFAAILDARLAE